MMKHEELKKLQSGRNKPRHIEEQIQTACIQWVRLAYPNLVSFAVPNGGSRNAIEAMHMKRSGVLAGVSDLIIVGTGKVLFVEMKTQKGRQSGHQKAFQQAVERLGHRYVVCRSFDEFKREVEQFINKEKKS